MASSSSRSVKSLQVRVITPLNRWNAFAEAVRSLWVGFRQARELSWRFFLRDTRADHRQTLLGYFWLVFPPLANTLTWVFLNRQHVVRIDTGNVPYAIFVLSGSLLWGAFNGSVMAMIGIVGTAKGVLSRVNFPREALVYSAVMKSSLESCLSAVLLIPALFVFHVSVDFSAVLFLVALFGSMLLGWAIGLFFLPIAALYGDVSRVLQVALRYGFFLTPVIFRLPERGFGRSLMLANPVTPIIVWGRSWLTGAVEVLPVSIWLVFAISAVLFSISLVAYKIVLPTIIERVAG